MVIAGAMFLGVSMVAYIVWGRLAPPISEAGGKPTLEFSFGGKGGKFFSLPRMTVWGLWGGEIDLGEEKPELEGGTKYRSLRGCCFCESSSCSGGLVITNTGVSLIAGGILKLVGLGKELEGAVGEVGTPLEPRC